MIRIFVNEHPKAKKRHRTGRMGHKTISYDPQHGDKLKSKWLVASLLRDEGLLNPLESPIECHVVSYHPFPKSWSKKRLKEVKESGCWKTSRFDVDNISKYYLDVLNGIAYKDDAQIVQLWSEKKYSDTPGVEIILNPKEVHMVNEHAITISKNCSIEQIAFLVKKANRLGKSDREVVSVYSRDDDEGSHIIFEVTDMKPRGMR